MDFKEFTDNIVELLKQKAGDTCTVTATEVLKNNDVHLTGIVIMNESDSISPTIYLEEPYRQYQGGASLQELAEKIMELYEKHAGKIDLDVDYFRDYSRVEKRIYHKLISLEKNKELLKDVPYFKWHDLAIVFYHAMEEPVFGRASIMIHNSHLDMWGKDPEEIYQAAQQNMKQSMPELLISMKEQLEEMAGVEIEENGNLYVLTNREKIFGASAMLYSEKIKELADRLGSDLLILPSSVHETLLLPDDREQGYGFYKKMVNEVNTTRVDPEEILSFSLYRYDRRKGEIVEIAETEETEETAV